MLRSRPLPILICLLALSARATAQEKATPDKPQKTTEERLAELEKKLGELDEEDTQQKAEEKGKTTPILRVGPDGFGIQSADGDFQLKFRGVIQTDGRFYPDDKASATDTFLFRRVRPIMEGTVFENYDFRFMPDFAGGKTELQDSYLEWRYWPGARILVGKVTVPVGLEQIQSDSVGMFLEPGFPTSLVPNRDVGVQLSGALWGGAANYAIGVFNGVPDGVVSGDFDNADPKDIGARLFLQPFKGTSLTPLQGLGFGVAGTVGDQEATIGSANSVTNANLPSLKTFGQQTFFKYRAASTAPTLANTAVADGNRNRLSPQLYYYWGPFGLLSEYALSKQEVRFDTSQTKLRNDAWHVSASYVLTGDNASYTGVVPGRPFDLEKGGWGAFELAARYGELDVDNNAFPTFADPTQSASKATAWAIGLNWYLNKNVKLAFDYGQTAFDGGAAGGNDRDIERVVLARAQIAF